jgi:hypothetical protein
MTNLDAFKIQIRKPDGSIVVDNLPHDASGTNFTLSLSFPGQQVIDTFTVPLLPDWGHNSHLRVMYDKLDYFQEVWIFNTFTGELLFVGLILDITATESNKSIRGDSIMHYLTRQSLGQFEFIEGDLTYALTWLTSPWHPLYLEDFDGTGWLSNWQTPQGVWTTPGGVLTCNSPTGLAYNEFTITSMPYRWRVELSTPPTGTARDVTFFISEVIGGVPQNQDFSVTLSHEAGVEGENVILEHSGGIQYQRFGTDYNVADDTRVLLDIWVFSDRVQVWLNGVEWINEQASPITTSGLVRFHISAEQGQEIFNTVRFERKPYLTLPSPLPTIHAGSDASQEFSKSSNYQAIAYYVDRFDLESRLLFDKDGDHKLEVGDSLGEDKRQWIVFERGKNITRIQNPASSTELATVIDVAGSGQNVNQILASRINIEAIEVYGWIEKQVNAQDLSLHSIANGVAESILSKHSGGIESLEVSVTVDNITRSNFFPGDFVWVRDDRIGIDRAARIIRTRTQDGSPVVDVTFDNQPADMLAELQRHRSEIDEIRRSYKGSTGPQNIDIPRQNLWRDDTHDDIFYVEGQGATAPPGGTVTCWQNVVGISGAGAWNGSLHFVNLDWNDTGDWLGAYAEITVYGTGFEYYARKDTNLTLTSIWIDDFNTPVATVDLNVSNPNDKEDMFLVYQTDALDPGPHTVRIARDINQTALNEFTSIDAIRLKTWFKEFFIEGKTVNEVTINWSITDAAANPVDQVPVKLKIDGIDRTVELGGPALGWKGNQQIDALQFLSKPGLHQVEFYPIVTLPFPAGEELDLFIEASINIKALQNI